MSRVTAAALAETLHAKPAGDGRWQARCPAHEDAHASLSLASGADGRVLVHCHAGCEPAAILEPLGLALRDLMPPSSGTRRIAATYAYRDESGAPLYEVVRFDPKDFRQRHRALPGEKADRDGWCWSMAGVRRVLYRLPETIAAVRSGATIYVVEGEKDADAMARLGLAATCNVGGAGKWRPEYGIALAGAPVVVIADRDDPGRAHAAKVAHALPGAHVVEVPTGKDAADWIASGATRGDFERLGSTPPSVAAQLALAPPPAPTPIGDGRIEINGIVSNSVSSIETLLTEHRALLLGDDAPLRINRLTGQIEHGLPGGPVLRVWDLDDLVTAVRISVEQRVHVETKKLDEQGRPIMAMLRVPDADVKRVLLRLAREAAFSPVAEWLERLPSVAPGAIDMAAKEALGLTDDLSRKLWRKWLIGCAARALRPGCQLDTALVLVAPRGGEGKSSLFRALASDAWFSDTHLDMTGFGRTNAYLQLHQVWLYEVPELEGARTEVARSRTKSFISSRSDNFRAPYAAAVAQHPRAMALAATTNSLDFLTADDLAFNRRFWPIAITGEIDVALVASLRAQIWAEARDAYLAGEAWHLGPEDQAEVDALRERQGDYAEADAWEPLLADHVLAPARVGKALRMIDIMRQALHYDASKIAMQDQLRAGRVLRGLGWGSLRRRWREGEEKSWRWLAMPPSVPLEQVVPLDEPNAGEHAGAGG